MNEYAPVTEINETNFDAWIARLNEKSRAAQQEAEDREAIRDHALLVEIQSLPENQQRERMATCLERQKSLHMAAEQLANMRAALTAPYDKLVERVHAAMREGHIGDFTAEELSIQENRALQQHQSIARAEHILANEQYELDRELAACVAVLFAGYRVQRPAEA